MRRSRLLVCTILFLLLSACNSQEPFAESFADPGNWRRGDDIEASGTVVDGRYEMLVKADGGLHWTTAGEEFGDGVFQLEATQIAGPVDAGYGMIFRVNEETDSFYLFEISSDGYVWIGRCSNACSTDSDTTILIRDYWFGSSAIQTGLDATNRLRVEAEDGNLIFSINETEVGRVTDGDGKLTSGDIGLLVETLGIGGARVVFDNFTVDPIGSSN